MKPLNLKEIALKEEMKERCLAKGQYIDENAKAKFEMLCHLEDFEVQYWELQQENKQLKDNWNKLNKKYENAVADYEQTMFEKEQLKKQLEEANEKIILLQASEPMLNYKKALEENQQKEFIEYLEDCINELKKESMNKLENTISLGIADVTKTILSKYKEIIGCK